MDKLKFETPDMVAGNIEKIGALFPAAITEMRGEDGQIKKGINFEVLKQLLSRDVVDGDECYEFTWVGKKAAIAEAARPITKTLRPVKEDSRDWDTTQNLYIEGDNLEVLKILQESYLGKVKMIYIDPPYNTGHDFIYRDKFQRSQQEENEQMGMYDEDEKQMFENTDSNGRFHSDWCSMMYSRLALARNLLTDDGVIFISIGEEEIENIYFLSNEVFGKHHHIGTFIWKRRQMVDSRSKTGVSEDHEYLLCYTKTNGQRILGAKADMSKYSNPDNDSRGDWMSADMTGLATASQRPNLHYNIENPETGIMYACPPLGWRYDKYRMKELIQEKEIIWPNSPEGRPRRKKFIKDLQSEYTGLSTILNTVFNTQATRELKYLFDGEDLFDFPKPVEYLKLIIKQGVPKEGIILDFFSGSATTAHAAMQLNAEDGGHRKFIMVQLPEPCDEKSEAFKAGYKNICEIGKERIRRAGDKIKEDNPLGTQDLDIGFRVFRVDSSNIKDVYYQPEELEQQSIFNLVSNIKDDRTDLDLLYACLLDWGVEIHLPHTSTDLDGCTIHNVDNGALMACFSPNVPRSVVEYMAKQQPLRAVFRDSAFASDDAKINVTEIFKNLSPDTKVKVI